MSRCEPLRPTIAEENAPQILRNVYIVRRTMNTHRPRLALALTCAAILGNASIASAQWTNFTDYAPGAGTAANALSLTSIPVSPGVPVALKDINTGANLTPTVTAFYSGNVTFEGTQGNPAPDTPLYNVFTGYVD